MSADFRFLNFFPGLGEHSGNYRYLQWGGCVLCLWTQATVSPMANEVSARVDSSPSTAPLFSPVIFQSSATSRHNPPFHHTLTNASLLSPSFPSLSSPSYLFYRLYAILCFLPAMDMHIVINFTHTAVNTGTAVHFESGLPKHFLSISGHYTKPCIILSQHL